ncbi:hypothetical protein [Oceanicoccus sp. KOV_DT_Chl]|uniref:hypothetical protein n=1 Tax=Oceanicoccus sp. KOV_DT_Chl TaxID=1904639 RepID=UPI000C7ADBC8|nr:hypothetical protein [Oceanicoccus sp. KOV_DT_Chl]
MADKVNKYLVSLLIILSAAACMAELPEQPVVPQSSQTVQLIRSPAANASSPYAMEYQWLHELQVNVPATLSLQWSMPAHHGMSLAFIPSTDYQLAGLEPLYFSDEQGALQITLQITPLHSGKSYIKFSANSLDGLSQQAFAIVVRIQQEAAAEKAHSDIKRIALPAITH